jgi:hypothetical protein
MRLFLTADEAKHRSISRQWNSGIYVLKRKNLNLGGVRGL